MDIFEQLLQEKYGVSEEHKIVEDKVPSTMQGHITTKDFLKDLDNAIVEKAERNKWRPSTFFSPSGMQCSRAMYYKGLGTDLDETKVNPNLVGITDVGNARHDKLQETIAESRVIQYLDVGRYVKEHKLPLEIREKQGNEVLLRDKERNLSFKCDGIIKYQDEIYVLEIKTESSKKFKERQGVNPAHIDQATAYALALEINQVMFLDECRDNSMKKAYVFEVTDNLKDEMQRKIDRVLWAMEKNEIPPRYQPYISKGACQYCNYRQRCKKTK